jgi:hypothetical protein
MFYKTCSYISYLTTIEITFGENPKAVQSSCGTSILKHQKFTNYADKCLQLVNITTGAIRLLKTIESQCNTALFRSFWFLYFMVFICFFIFANVQNIYNIYNMYSQKNSNLLESFGPFKKNSLKKLSFQNTVLGQPEHPF